MRIAKKDEMAELFDKFNSVPFDDLVNRMASLDMIRRGYLETSERCIGLY